MKYGETPGYGNNDDLPPEVTDYIRRMAAFSNGENHNCPECGKPVAGIKLYAKIEPDMFSLYVLPCDHRLGLWGGAPEWVKEAGLPVEVVPSVWDDDSGDDGMDDEKLGVIADCQHIWQEYQQSAGAYYEECLICGQQRWVTDEEGDL